MRVWRGTYHDDDSGSGTVAVWASSKRGAEKMLREAGATEPKNFNSYDVEPIDFKPTRAGIVALLNRYADDE